MSSNPDRIEEFPADETTPLIVPRPSDDATNGRGEDDPLLAPPPYPGRQSNGSAASKPDDGTGDTAPAREDDDDRPLPKFQIFLLSCCRLIEPIAFFSIFPFVNQMIKETGDVDEKDVGFYSGLIESLFSCTQMTLMIFWGRMSDRFGRKPVLTVSLFWQAITVTLFGFSKNLWQMILFRCLAGVFSGTVVTIRTMFSENSTAKTQARAFSWYAFATNIGIFVGPLIGGVLARPADQYPKAFGNVQFFHDYPFALPTIVVGAANLIPAVLSALFIKETLQRKDAAPGQTAPPPPMSTWQLIRSPGVAMVLLLYSFVMVLAYAFTAMVPVFWFTSVDLGGFGFSSLLISIFMGLGGLSQAVWLLLPFPPLQRRFGTRRVLNWCAVAWPFFFAVNPLCNVFLKVGAKPAFWIFAVAAEVLGSGVAMAFTASQLALNDVVPSPDTLGTLNAIALTLATGLRAATPALTTALYAVGVGKQIADGQLGWLVLIIMAVCLRPMLVWFPKNAESKLKREEQDDTESQEHE